MGWNRWDKFLTSRHDSEAEIAAEDAAKAKLQHGIQRHAPDQQEQDDAFQQKQLLPLWLRPADIQSSAADGRAIGSYEDTIEELQHMAFPSQQAAELDSGREVITDVGPLTPYNESALTPLIPTAVMWLVAEAEEKLRNDSWLNLDLAISLARLQSVAYCHFPNVQAWNCSRYPPSCFLGIHPSQLGAHCRSLAKCSLLFEGSE